MNGLHTPDCIRAHSGVFVNVFEPHPNMFKIEDIAHALSQQCRWGGHTPKFYSVAEHCVLAAEACPGEHALAALLHDASEAYLCDIPTPIKRKLLNYEFLEDRLMRVIAEKFVFEWPMSPLVKIADRQLLEVEWSWIINPKESEFRPECWRPTMAKKEFLAAYEKAVDYFR